MRAEGTVTQSQIPKPFYVSAKRLDNEVIEKGNVYKAVIDKNDRYSVEMLCVWPNSSVKKHTHIDDSEMYINLNTKEMEFCAQGQSHELVNTSADKYLIILSLKFKSK